MDLTTSVEDLQELSGYLGSKERDTVEVSERKYTAKESILCQLKLLDPVRVFLQDYNPPHSILFYTMLLVSLGFKAVIFSLFQNPKHMQ